MINIFVISNEHQLMQVDYVIDNIIADERSLLLCIKSIKESPPIKDFRDRRDIDVVFFESWVFQDIISLKKRHKSFIHLIEDGKNRYNEFKIYSSQYSSDYILLLHSILSPIEFYLLDEGTASIKVAQSRLNYISIKRLLKLLLKSFIYGIKLIYPEKLIYVSDYDLKINDRDSIIRIHHDIQNNKVDKIVNEIHIIGSSIVEAGIINKINYLNYIKAIINENKGVEILYFSHKKEEMSKIQIIKNIGINVVSYDIPYEFRFNKTTIKPLRIYSFISPVVYNIANKYKNTPELYSVSFPIEHILKSKSLYHEILSIYSRHPRIKTLYLD
ncbi:MAG TPA: hypothetical protein GXZ90_03890 [Clostridiales bacterium]|nr:hypothetical protein [Clostridiales bacterium]